MTLEHKELQQLNAQIQIKLAEGNLEEAERLSVKLVETAEGIQNPSGDAVSVVGSMVSKLFNSVASKFPQAPTAAQIAHIKEAAVNDEHLRLLTIFHYIYGGFNLLLSFIPMIYIGLGALMQALPARSPGVADSASAAQAGWIFIIFGAVMMLMFWVLAALNIATGRCLRMRRRRTLCYVVSAFNLMHMPLGTILGVCSFMVLSRPAIKSQFVQRA